MNKHKPPRHTNIIAAYLLLRQDDQVLLLERANTGYHDGDFSLIAGHVDPGESFSSCIKREALEEAGIVITDEDIDVVHVMHRKSASDNSERVDVFFQATQWLGEITNKEPHKCARLEWVDLNSLPENMIPCVRNALEHIQRNEHYSEFGWS